MMLVGKRETGVLMYLKQSRGVLRYMFLMSTPAKHAPGVLMVLFQRSLDDTMSVVRVVSSKG
jgi:hypothetical protein